MFGETHANSYYSTAHTHDFPCSESECNHGNRRVVTMVTLVGVTMVTKEGSGNHGYTSLETGWYCLPFARGFGLAPLHSERAHTIEKE